MISQLVKVILFCWPDLVKISNPLHINDATKMVDIKIKPSIIFERGKAGLGMLEKL